MKHWVITDTHFGHKEMIEYCGRPSDFRAKIMKNISSVLTPKDVLVHLGDICIGGDSWWNMLLRRQVTGKMWLLKGNHDKKSAAWYLDNGWDFVADMFTLKMYGHTILFSHKPQPEGAYTLNIHGHFHNSDHRRHEPELVKVKNSRQVLVMMEHEYRPLSLEKIVRSYEANLREQRDAGS